MSDQKFFHFSKICFYRQSWFNSSLSKCVCVGLGGGGGEGGGRRGGGVSVGAEGFVVKPGILEHHYMHAKYYNPDQQNTRLKLMNLIKR